jgi:hypothetical protein
MGSVGDCFDNAMAESFFASLECELIDRRRWRTHTEARMAVFDYIEDTAAPSAQRWRSRCTRVSGLKRMRPRRSGWF